MRRPARIMLEVLGPPILAAALLELVALVAMRELAALEAFPLLLLLGFVLAGVPSLVFAGIMELAFARGLRPGSLGAVRLAAVLGAASGWLIDLALAGSAALRPSAAFFIGLGSLVGGALGLLIRRLSRSSTPASRGEPGRSTDGVLGRHLQ